MPYLGASLAVGLVSFATANAPTTSAIKAIALRLQSKVDNLEHSLRGLIF
jgi:hypothetical protein